MKILCIGDSLTEGDYCKSPGIADVREKNYPYFLSELTKSTVINLGKCGFRASDWLRFYKEDCDRVTDCDFILIMLGTNGGFDPDRETEDNDAMREIIRTVKEDNPGAVVFLLPPPHCTVNPDSWGYGTEPRASAAREFVRKLAGESKLPLIETDRIPVFTAENEPLYQPVDGVHFGEEGYRAIAEFVFETLCDYRAGALLSVMSDEEKLYQLSSDMIFDVDGSYREGRNPLHGSYRNPGHFMHKSLGRICPADEVASFINEDVRISIDAQPHSIPPIENGEALHGAQWGMGTCFPQPINMASGFDPELEEECSRVIGKECRAVGVRQVFSPVINIVRDCRWGRTVESFGEDVKLTSDMAVAVCRGLESEGVTATPKHFADNYSEGGRDSNYSVTSERTMREVFLEPFRRVLQTGIAHSVMAAYNAWEGVPCHCNPVLLNKILKKEWNFGGFVVSDYCGVNGIATSHRLCAEEYEASAKAVKAGLDVILPFGGYDMLSRAYEEGLLSREDIDRAVFRVLKAKYRLGLFEHPFADAEKAKETVRCKEHRDLALKAARETIVLLKNSGVLPAERNKVRRIGVFGQGADILPVGLNYSGPYGVGWYADDAMTPLGYLRSIPGLEVVYASSSDIEKVAPSCDLNLYFTSIIEGEGADRSDIRLPSVTVSHTDDESGGLIVGQTGQQSTENQEDAIIRLCEADKNACVILLNGSPVDMSAWIDKCGAVIEAWYPGEQGAQALYEIIFGITNPSAKLPISFPRSAGQLPLYYSHKPSGRGYGYADNDGKPLYCFGYGLSYTDFKISDVTVTEKDGGADVGFTVENTGGRSGAEVVQLYIGGENCEVVRPLRELKAYRRVGLEPGEKKQVCLSLTDEDFMYYDAEMNFGRHRGKFILYLGNSSESASEIGCITIE